MSVTSALLLKLFGFEYLSDGHQLLLNDIKLLFQIVSLQLLLRNLLVLFIYNLLKPLPLLPKDLYLAL